jgi:outer membrane receptor for ferrienterochelin and colicins
MKETNKISLNNILDLNYQNVILLTVLILILISINSYAQTGTIEGKIIDETEQPIPGANVYLQGTILGAATSNEGIFSIKNVPTGNFTLIIAVIGYETKKLDINIISSEHKSIGIIQLKTIAMPGDPVVVTAGKYQQQKLDLPVSLNTLSKAEIMGRNSITLDKALKYVPGVNMNKEQINIRGSSGYSYGVGSRVLFLIDGVPLLTGDTREINYETIPIYLIERVEILKGAGSALYGSSALGGVVNIITRDIDQSGRYYFKLYGGMYSKPVYEEWEWSDKSRFFNGLNFYYQQKVNKIGFQLGGSAEKDDSYRQNDWRRRSSISGKLQWSPNAFQRLKISGNYMHQKRASFLYWRGLHKPYQPPEDQLGDRVKSNRYYVTTEYQHFLNANQYFTFRGIWFWNRFRDNIAANGGNTSVSKNLNGEIQFTSKFKKVLFIAGIESHYSDATSNIFGDRSGIGVAGYIQGDITLNPRWQIIAGARFDYFNIDSVESDNQINPKLGLVYKLYKDAALHISAGLGYRAPSMAELFTSTSSGGFLVIPNFNLKPEKSRYFELGYKHISGKSFYSEATYFYSHFTDLIEGEIVEGEKIQVQFQNIIKAQVQGVEISTGGNIQKVRLNYNIGYTYMDSKDLDTKEVLQFRPRHLFYIITSSNLSPFQIGIDYRFISKYEKIDNKFSLIINDAEQRVPIHVVDIRFIYMTRILHAPAKISFQINNLLRYNYVDLVGSLGQPQNFILSFECGF